VTVTETEVVAETWVVEGGEEVLWAVMDWTQEVSGMGQVPQNGQDGIERCLAMFAVGH